MNKRVVMCVPEIEKYAVELYVKEGSTLLQRMKVNFY